MLCTVRAACRLQSCIGIQTALPRFLLKVAQIEGVAALPGSAGTKIKVRQRATFVTAASMTSSDRGSYGEAIAALNTLQSNAATIEAIRKNGGKYDHLALPEMVEYLERIGWTQEDLNRLNVIHITGTKGKGSTSAFVDALVRSQASTSSSAPKVGLYTSPHLVQVRERIRINGLPISEDHFAKYFWEVWDRLGSNQQRKMPDMTPVRPVYFRYMTILAFHVFLSLEVECTILEVGIGGRYDSTNIVPRPIVTGITTLGLDHTAILGKTIEEIASQKAGIFKNGVPALSVWQQSEGARQILQEEAKKVAAASYQLLPEVSSASEFRNLELGIPGAHQASNAQLAVELSRAYRHSEAGNISAPSATNGTESERTTLSTAEKQALRDARWPGRCQIVRSQVSEGQGVPSSRTWFLDGAHTTESLESCAQWFIEASRNECSDRSSQPRRVLIFNTTHDRNSEELLRGMIEAMQAKSDPTSKNPLFDEILFSTNITYRQGKSAGDLTAVAGEVSIEPQRRMQKAWEAIDKHGKTQTQALASIEEAVEATQQVQDNRPQHILVAGSLHLVGGIMSHLKDAGLLDEALNSRF